MEIVRAVTEDAPEVARVHVISWQEAYKDIISGEFLAGQSVERRVVYWREAIVTGTPELLVAKQQGQVVGWIACGPCRDREATPQDAEVWALYLLPSWWQKGVGKALWLRARAQLQERGFTTASLWVLEDNHRAIRFYQSSGFQREWASVKEVVIGGKPLRELRYVCSL